MALVELLLRRVHRPWAATASSQRHQQHERKSEESFHGLSQYPPVTPPPASELVAARAARLGLPVPCLQPLLCYQATVHFQGAILVQNLEPF